MLVLVISYANEDTLFHCFILVIDSIVTSSTTFATSIATDVDIDVALVGNRLVFTFIIIRASLIFTVITFSFTFFIIALVVIFVLLGITFVYSRWSVSAAALTNASFSQDFDYLLAANSITLCLVANESVLELVEGLKLAGAEHRGHKQGVVVDLTLPHGEHDIGCGPSIWLIKAWVDRDTADKVRNFHQGADATIKLRLFLEPVPLFELVKELVVTLFRQQNVLIL